MQKRTCKSDSFFQKGSHAAKKYWFCSKITVQGAPWGLGWLLGREQPVTSTAFQWITLIKKWTSNTQTALLMMPKEMEDQALCTPPGRSICSCILTGGCAPSPASPCSAAAAAPGCRWTSGAAARGKPDPRMSKYFLSLKLLSAGMGEGFSRCSTCAWHTHSTGGRECGSPGTELIPLGLNPVCFWDFQTDN